MTSSSSPYRLSAIPAVHPGSHSSAAPDERSLPAIDVLVVTHNGQRHIRRCLESLVAGGTPLTSVTVVDNASTDGTVGLVREAFPEVRVLRSAANLGYGRAINLAMQAGSAPYVVVLNQDVVSLPGLVAHLVESLQHDASVALATPKILLRSNPERINACGNSAHFTGITTCRAYGRRSVEFLDPHRVGVVSGAAFATRRDVVELLGGVDPLFFMYLEDTDLSVRAALRGFASICVPAAMLLHDFEPKFSKEKIFWLERNRALVLLRVYRFRTLLVLAPALLLVELLVLGYGVSRGPAGLLAKLRAYAWILHRLPQIARSRHRVQALRRVGDRELFEIFTSRLDVDELEGRLPRVAAAVVNPALAAWFAIARAVVRW